MCQQTHTCRNLWRNKARHYASSNKLNLHFNSHCSTDSNGVVEPEEVKSVDAKVLKRLETIEDSVIDDSADDSQYEDRQFTKDEVRRVMELFKEREGVIESVATDYHLEGNPPPSIIIIIIVEIMSAILNILNCSYLLLVMYVRTCRQGTG